MFKVITGTLQANHISMQLTDDTISDDSIFEVYTDTENIIPSSVSVGGHTVTITFDSKPSSNVGVKVLVNNIVGEYLPEISASDVSYNDSTVDETLDNISEDILDISTTIDERVPSDTTLGGVLYHATTGNTWKKLDASNIDYDSGSTIYSAMGDIDDLTTESKNIVGAINEVKENASSLPNYNVNEVEMPYKWIDGRSIYRRVIIDNENNYNLGNSTWKDTGIYLGGYITCISAVLLVKYSLASNHYPIVIDGGSTTLKFMHLRNLQFEIPKGSMFVLEYVKEV